MSFLILSGQGVHIKIRAHLVCSWAKEKINIVDVEHVKYGYEEGKLSSPYGWSFVEFDLRRIRDQCKV